MDDLKPDTTILQKKNRLLIFPFVVVVVVAVCEVATNVVNTTSPTVVLTVHVVLERIHTTLYSRHMGPFRN